MGKRRPSGDGMVRKRDDGRWEGRIVVGHKANGDPIFRHVYAKTQKALTEKLHQSIECYQDVELTEDSRMTLGEWLDRWLAEYKDGTIRSGTLEGYRNYIENYIKPQLGGKQVSLITTQDVQRMYRRLKNGGRVREDAEGSKRLSDSTVRHIHTMLHGAMKAAVQAHIIPKNPTENATVPKSNYKPMQVLNEQELDTFLQAVQKDDIWRDFFYTELMTGLRRGEICALMWRDFDAKAGTLGISRTLHSKGQGIYALGDTKTSQGNRTIILPESVAALLRARDELQRFLIQAQAEGYYELFLLDLATGLRRGELLALQWDDLDFETGVLTISKQVSLVRGKIVMSVPKTKSSIRKLVLPPAVVQESVM